MRDSYTNPSKTKRIEKYEIFCFHETNPQNESFKNRSTKRIHETNLSKTGLRNKSTKRIFWNQYGFANLKPRIRMDSGLFKVRLCTKDSSGFVMIRWIRFIRHKSNLFGVSIRDYETKWIHGFAKQIHVFTNLLYDYRILINKLKLSKLRNIG